MEHGTRLFLRPGVLVSRQGKAGFLTDLDSGNVFELNDVATRILEALRPGRTLAEAVQLIQQSHPEQPPDELAQDVKAWVKVCLGERFIEHRA